MVANYTPEKSKQETKEDDITTEEATNENCPYRKKETKCKECEKQHIDKNNANGKQLAVIKNNTGKS